MQSTKRMSRSRTLWMLALHLIAQTFAYYGVDVQLIDYADAANNGLTAMEIAEVVTVLLAAYFRVDATHALR